MEVMIMMMDTRNIQRCRTCGAMHELRVVEINLSEFYCEVCGFINKVVENDK